MGPLVVARVQFSIRLVAILPSLEKALGLGFLAGLHPLRDDGGEPALADHLQDVMTVELPAHQGLST